MSEADRKIRITSPFTYTFSDYPDNSSHAIVINIFGCEHGCHGCHNPQFAQFDGSLLYNENQSTKEVTAIELESLIVASLKRAGNIVDKVVIQGGEPLHPNNLPVVSELIQRLKLKKLGICVYTGYNADWIRKNKIFGFTYIKTGQYMKDEQEQPKKTNDFIQFASRNQCLYDWNLKLLSKNGKHFFRNKKHRR